MARGKKGTGSKAVVWVILILLIVGLAGFGATNFGGSVSSIGKVGDREINVDRYARELQNQMQAFSQQIGTDLTLSQAQAFGLDRAVLQRLVSTVALENEADKLGLSAGDAEVRRQILTITAFQGIDGKFDREAYRFALERSGRSEQEFEEGLRAEIARTMVQGAVAGGVQTPKVYGDTLVRFIGEQRNFAWIEIGVDALETPIGDPTEADLRAYFDAHQDDFMLPESRAITYAWLTPDMIVDKVQIDEAALRALYEERIAEFIKPQRRLVERLILGDAAADAKTRLDAGQVTFEELVAERDLELEDIDLGDVTEADLDRAGPAVFASDEPGIVGPVDTDLGAALFRVNAILAAQETSFDDARAELVGEYALDHARRDIEDQIDHIDDLLAGGATLEELASETDMKLGQIDWTAGSDQDIAGYEAFRSAAAAAAAGDYPEVVTLDDGGIFALRINEITAPRLQDFADAEGRANSGWRAAETAMALAEQARAIAAKMKAGEVIPGLMLKEQPGVTRETFVADTPPNFLETVFRMNPGDVEVIEGDTSAFLVSLDSIFPPASDDPDLTERRAQMEQATAQSIGDDLLQAFSAAVQTQAGITLNQAAINAIHAQFP